jgi:hypothetical protein
MQGPNHTVSFEPGALRKRKENIAAHRIGKRQKWQWFADQSKVAKQSSFYPGRSLVGRMVLNLIDDMRDGVTVIRLALSNDCSNSISHGKWPNFWFLDGLTQQSSSRVNDSHQLRNMLYCY